MTRTSLRVDVDEWTQELIAIWKPRHILQVRNEGTLGLLFIAQVHPDLTLHLRVQWNGIDTCTIWQGQRYLLWSRATGFLSTPRPQHQPSPVPKEPEEWETAMRALIRRNCFLMGGQVEATEEEKRQWLDSYQKSTPSPLLA